MTFKVHLNGTGENPWHAAGLKQNPFPQVAKSEYAGQLLHLAALGGDPVPDADFIRKHLRGWSTEFVELCCRMFEKGEYVEFEITWDGAA